MTHTWDWQVFFLDTGTGITYFQWMMSAWGWTVAVSLLSLLLALILGTIIGVLLTVPNRGLVFFAQAWTELFRNIPLLVQVFIWYQVVPYFIPPLLKFPSFLLVVIALGLFTSTRIAAQVRSGIESLPKGQRYAGLALGFTLTQTYRYVLLPVAARIVLPPITSEAMGIVKNSAVGFAVSVAELTQFAMQSQEETTRGIEIYIAVTLLYFITSLAINRVLNFIERRIKIPGHSGPSMVSAH